MMNIEDFRTYCLSFPYTSESTPFGPDTLVFKVKDKMFALADLKMFESINLKCDPEKAIELRAEYPAVREGYHMNKKHWNTIEMDGSISDELIRKWVKDSYLLVIENLPKGYTEKIKKLIG